jgi:glycosyltransferase involved in cell wall biosynthesis
MNIIQLIITILIIIFSGSILVQLLYYLVYFRKLAFFKGDAYTPDKKTNLPVSVVICARNESKNLKKYLEKVLTQNYPSFEVVVVNDCSWDDTAEFLDRMELKYTNLKIVTIKEQVKYRHGKKLALTLGIKAAVHEILLLTDADCMPAGSDWIQSMVSGFEPANSHHVDFVLGYGAYQHKWGILNRLIRYDTFYGALQYFSFALSGLPYMGVGRNLAYRRELFFKNKGFGIYNHFLSGDDDLFVNMLATSENTSIEIRPESFTHSEPKTTYSDWFRQKSRHISTSKFYKLKHRMMLGILWASHYAFYMSMAALLIFEFDWRIVIALFSIRFVSQSIIMGNAMKRIKELDLLPFILFFDFFILLFYSILAVNNLFISKHKWK